jgi:hypothetical protein
MMAAIIDAVVTPDGSEAKRLDLMMLGMLTGKERSEREFRGLLAEGGFELRSVTPAPAPVPLAVLYAAPAR